jgi:hypothetical protein
MRASSREPIAWKILKDMNCMLKLCALSGTSDILFESFSKNTENSKNVSSGRPCIHFASLLYAPVVED